MKKADRYLALSMLFYTVAGLLKVSSLISFCAILGILAMDWTRLSGTPEERTFGRPTRQVLYFLPVIIIQVAWYTYASNYNAAHNGGNFLIGILPIWNLDTDQVMLTLEYIREHFRWDYFRPVTMFFLIGAMAFTLIIHKSNDSIVNSLILFLLLGFVLFVVLFFEALMHHDYYVINLYIMFPVVLSGFFLVLKNRFNKLYRSVLFRILLILFLVHNIDFAMRRMKERYDPNSYINKESAIRVQKFGNIRPYLRSIGIADNERVINLSDISIDISLYLMDRKGWTNYNLDNDSTRIRNAIRMGASFILSTEDDLNDRSLAPFFSHPIGEYRGIRVYGVW